jgi:pimeloyl-ACP methyl ester carboxylesterase
LQLAPYYLLAAGDKPEPITYGSNAQAGQHADVNGIKMYYEIYGGGDPLLVIHGNGQSIADMHFQIAHFAGNYQVIVADSRGNGKSGLDAGCSGRLRCWSC